MSDQIKPDVQETEVADNEDEQWMNKYQQRQPQNFESSYYGTKPAKPLPYTQKPDKPSPITSKPKKLTRWQKFKRGLGKFWGGFKKGFGKVWKWGSPFIKGGANAILPGSGNVIDVVEDMFDRKHRR